jgi:hypothetical protein
MPADVLKDEIIRIGLRLAGGSKNMRMWGDG